MEIRKEIVKKERVERHEYKEEVTYYYADDGKRFLDKDTCLIYEKYLNKVKDANISFSSIFNDNFIKTLLFDSSAISITITQDNVCKFDEMGKYWDLGFQYVIKWNDKVLTKCEKFDELDELFSHLNKKCEEELLRLYQIRKEKVEKETKAPF